MKRKKDTKPLFSLKADFVASLEHFCQQAIMLEQQVRQAVALGAVDERVKDLIVARLNAFRAAMVSDDE
jgi:hypothetical protein